MSLKKQAVSGMVWTFAEQFGTQFINFLINIILARILLPTDFGTIAMFSIVMAIASTLLDGGMASSLVRTHETNEDDLSTVFWFNIVASIVLYIIIFFLSPFIANFYNQPILNNIIRIYCLLLIVNSFVVVQKVHFIKELRFNIAFKIQLPSLIIGGFFGVFFAYLGYGVWALVINAIVQNFVFTIQHWLYSDWRPKFIFSKKKFHYHFHYGYKMSISGILNILFINIYTIIIGKFFSAQQLGYYNRADSLKQLPLNNISTALNKVTFPLFAKISHDNDKLKEVYKKLMKTVIFIVAPVLGIMVVSAEPLIKILLTDKWLPMVPYFQVLSIAGLLLPIHSYNLNVLKVKGRSDLFLKLEIIKKIIITLTILISIHFGIYGLLIGQIFTSILAFFVNTYYTGKMLHYNSFQQARDLCPAIILAAITAFAIYLLNYYCLKNLIDVFRLLSMILIYALLYLGTAYVFKLKEIDYIKELIKK